MISSGGDDDDDGGGGGSGDLKLQWYGDTIWTPST